MKLRIENENEKVIEVEIEDVGDLIDLFYTELEQSVLTAYEDELDSMGDVEIFSYGYRRSKVLKSVDEICFREGFLDFVDCYGTMVFDSIENGEDFTDGVLKVEVL